MNYTVSRKCQQGNISSSLVLIREIQKETGKINFNNMTKYLLCNISIQLI